MAERHWIPNPTGKGLVHPQEQSHRNNQKKAAGHELTRLMIETIMEPGVGGKSRAENMCRNIAKKAETGDIEASEWFLNRIIGRPVQQSDVSLTVDANSEVQQRADRFTEAMQSLIDRSGSVN